MIANTGEKVLCIEKPDEEMWGKNNLRVGWVYLVGGVKTKKMFRRAASTRYEIVGHKSRTDRQGVQDGYDSQYFIPVAVISRTEAALREMRSNKVS
jgi:hypothetical protein